MRFLFSFLMVAMLISACKSTGKLSNATDGNSEGQPMGKVIEGFASPESILLTRSGMFVSNVGTTLMPRDLDGDGYISKLTTEGAIDNEQFIVELNAPKGMAEQKGILYVADIDQIKAFKIDSGDPVDTYDFREYGATFLNDIVFYSNGELLVTDTDLNMIFSLNLNTRRVQKIAVPDDFAGPNGLYFDQTSERLLIVGFGMNGEPTGKVALIYPSDNPNGGGIGGFEILDTPEGLYDGVALVDGKYVVFSDWGDEGVGRVRYYDMTTKETWLVNLENKISGPADFAFDPDKKCLWIPGMKDGKIYQEFLTFY